jgi:hypothetical protein
LLGWEDGFALTLGTRLGNDDGSFDTDGSKLGKSEGNTLCAGSALGRSLGHTETDGFGEMCMLGLMLGLETGSNNFDGCKEG